MRLPLRKCRHTQAKPRVVDHVEAVGLLGYGVLSHTIGWLLIASSLPQVSTTEAGLALLLQPTLSYAWDVLLFERSLQPIEFAGAVVALLAIYLGSRPASKKL